jgi:hypothetical protein
MSNDPIGNIQMCCPQPSGSIKVFIAIPHHSKQSDMVLPFRFLPTFWRVDTEYKYKAITQ